MPKHNLKDSNRISLSMSRSDQDRGAPMPPIQKPVPDGARLVKLPEPEKTAGKYDLSKAIAGRKSRRMFRDDSVSLEELSFLLWATQGVRDRTDPSRVYRNVPSAGNRHALETYLAVFRVRGLGKGIYRYLPLEHALVLVSAPARLEEAVSEACLGQNFAGSAAVTFIWSVVRYRMEWRYANASIKLLALDAGHVCQNLYLACESIGCGTCALAAYDQEAVDKLLGVDGDGEFAIYIAPVGKARD
jgi:SagB-type dehydrogenase family enzyme